MKHKKTPKAAHTKLFLIKNMQSHLFVDCMATITFWLKILPFLKNALLTADSDFQLLCTQNVWHMYVCWLCTKGNLLRTFIVYVKFNNMMNK